MSRSHCCHPCKGEPNQKHHSQCSKVAKSLKNTISALLAGKTHNAGNSATELPSDELPEDQDVRPETPPKSTTHRRTRVISETVYSCDSRKFQIDSPRSPQPESYPTDILHAPRITHLDLPPSPFEICPPATWDESWRNYTAIAFKAGMTVGQCLYVLRECPNLQQFVCSLDQNPHWEASSHSTVSCPNLTHLTIKTSVAPKVLFDRLRLHNLVELTLQWTSRIPQFQPPDELGLAQMLRRSESRLLSLSLIDTYPTALELIHVLRASQFLESLVIRTDKEVLPHDLDYWIASKAVLGYLSIDPDHYPCPSLRSIELSPCYSADGLLADMVEQRSASPLNLVTYSFDDHNKHLYDMKRLQRHQALQTKHGRQLRVVHVVHNLPDGKYV